MPVSSVNIFGNYALSDLPNVPIGDVTVDDLMGALTAFLAAENSFLTELLGLISDTGTELQTSFSGGVGGRLQMLGAISSLEATRHGKKWQVGFPIFAKGTAQAFRHDWLERATLKDVNDAAVNAGIQDVETVITDALASIFRNDSYVFDDDPWPGGHGATTTVYPLANNDSATGSVYTPFGGEVAIGTANMYLASGTAGFTAAAFSTAKTLLRGFGLDGRIVHIVSRASADLIAAMAGFVPASNDVIDDPAAVTAVVSAPRAIGRVGLDEVWEMPHFPDMYILTLDLTAPPPLRMRISPDANKRGLRIVQDQDLPEVTSHPLLNKTFKRFYGFGVRNRVNGCITKITAGAYTVPTL